MRAQGEGHNMVKLEGFKVGERDKGRINTDSSKGSLAEFVKYVRGLPPSHERDIIQQSINDYLLA